jgi:hypothetical protein
MPDGAIVIPDTTAAPKDYTLAGAQEIALKSVRAVIDGSAAGSAFLPTLQLLDQNGHVCWEGATSSTVAAGGSADVSWFPGLGGTGSVTATGATAVMDGLTSVGSTQTIAAGTSARIHFDLLQADTSGVFDVSAGSGTTWKVNTTGTYQVMFFMSPSATWAPAGSSPYTMNLNTLGDLWYSQENLVDPDGSNQTIGFIGFFVAHGTIPARVSVSIFNHAGVDLVTFGPNVKVVCSRIGDELPSLAP